MWRQRPGPDRPPPRFRPRLPAVPLVLAAPALAALLATAGVAQPSENATVREILDGNQLFIDARQAKVNQTALTPQEITTQNSRGQLEFQTGAAARINRFTQLRLGKSCFLLSKGQVLISGKQSGCTKSLRLSSRGTNYLISVNDDGTVDVIVLEGTVQAELLQPADDSSETARLLGDLLAAINSFRNKAGNPPFPPIPPAVQTAINPYGLLLINAMRKANGCFHGGSHGVPLPFDFVRLPAGWAVVGEVLGCPAEPGVWDPGIVARMLWESPTHKRIVFDSRKPTAIGCIWSTARTKQDTEAMVCLTLRSDSSKATTAAAPGGAAPDPLLIRAGFRFRFSNDGKVISSFRLGRDHYEAILSGPFFQGFGSALPELEALKRLLRDQLNLDVPVAARGPVAVQ